MTGQRVTRLPKAFAPLLKPARRKIVHGGRGSGKTRTLATLAILRAASEPIRVLCCREQLNSIEESSYREIRQEIERLGLGSFFTATKTSIRGRNGSEFMFTGLKNSETKIKSISNVGICWTDEAQAVTAATNAILGPSIRAAGSELWYSLNPLQADQVIYQMAMDPPADTIVLQVNFDANPYFTPELEDERQLTIRNDPDAYDHVWLGAPATRTEALVYSGAYEVREFEPTKDFGDPMYGLDFGFSVSRNVLLRAWVADDCLWVDYAVYGRQTPIADLPALLAKVPGSDRHVIRADSARPETIDFCKSNGYPRMRPTKKGPNSVKDGIEHIRGAYRKIIVHPRCAELLEELRLYSYRVNRSSGDVTGELVKAHDDGPDALRYAIEPLIGGGSGYTLANVS